MKFAKEETRITTALLLAAGTGSRLQPITDDAPKCLTKVNGKTILEQLLANLCKWGFKRLVVVVGHYERHIVESLASLTHGLTIEIVTNAKYRTTNNIYSLWAARKAIQEPFLLIESDLVFDVALLKDMLQPDKIAVSNILPWMNGTMVAVDHSQRVTRFHADGHSLRQESTYKTVNMYSFSRSSWRRVVRRLEEHVSAGKVNTYYETVLGEMVVDGSLALRAVFFDDARWYEIDTPEDLHQAERTMLRVRREPVARLKVQRFFSEPDFRRVPRAAGREKTTPGGL